LGPARRPGGAPGSALRRRRGELDAPTRLPAPVVVHARCVAGRAPGAAAPRSDRGPRQVPAAVTTVQSSARKTLVLAAVLTAGVVLYLVLLAGRAFALLRSGETVGVVLGVGVLMLPFLGAWMVITTWMSGVRVAGEGGRRDVSARPRRPSGRVEREAADAYFAKREAELAQAPQDWRAWYRVAHAYDIAGDRRRARDAMKRAVALEAEERNA